MDLKFLVRLRIQKPVREVFDAVRDPSKLSGYFTNGGASGPLAEGSTVQWAFADDPDAAPISFPVTALEVRENELIVLEWEGARGLNTRVEIGFEEIDGETIVAISETGWRETQQDLESSYLNCFGWGQMLCCLKAYVEYGIDLRKGAFRGLYKPEDFIDAVPGA
jgi:uncharacterized protein YndB with AHSA1/START domain